jgi:isoquinoline 1-oxidoreductase alpha subunit
VTVGSAAGKTIWTIEGLSAMSSNPAINRLQQAWVTEQVPQCGYCQSGMIMQAAALLLEREGEDNPVPSASDISGAMKNICVCGTYQRVKAAIIRAATGG